MSYQKHNYVSGYRVSGEDMAEMDDQILKNEGDIAVLRDDVDAVPDQLDARMQNLTLDVDGDSVYLLMNGIMLGRAALPNTSSLVACTNLTVTGITRGGTTTSASSILGLDVDRDSPDHTATINTSVTPSGTNQYVRFVSGDKDVATVTMAGLVKALTVGATTITVSCGGRDVVIPVTTKKTLDQTPYLGFCSWLSQQAYRYGDTNHTNAWQFNAGMVEGLTNYYVGNTEFDFDSGCYALKPNQKVTISFTNDAAGNACELMFVYVIKRQTPGAELSNADNLLDMRYDEDGEPVDNQSNSKIVLLGMDATALASYYRWAGGDAASHSRSFTYANTQDEDVYVVFAYWPANSGNWEAEDKQAWVDAELANPHVVYTIEGAAQG